MFSSIKEKFNLQRFFVGEGPLYPPYVLTQRRVYILPTRQGFAFALLLFIMLLGSINYSNSLGYFLTFFLSSLSVVAIFHTYNNLLKLSFGPAICSPVFAEDNSHFLVHVNNLDHQSRYSIYTYTQQNSKTSSDINENSVTKLTINHSFSQRGLIDLPRFTVETRFPFGLFRAWALVQFDQKIMVYPKPSSHTLLPIKNSGLSEGKKQLNIGTDDFKGLRSFVEGDALQHIHWKSFARHQTLQTKEFSSTTSDELWLNYSETTTNGTEAKLSQLTRWLLLSEKSTLTYGLCLPNVVIPPNSGKKHLALCLKQLSLYGSNDLV